MWWPFKKKQTMIEKPPKWIIRKRQTDGTIKHLVTLSQQPDYNSLANYGSGEYLIQECQGKKFSKAQKVTIQSQQPQKPEKVIAKAVKPKVQIDPPHRPKQEIAKTVKPKAQVAQSPKSKKVITKLAPPKIKHVQPHRPIPRPSLPVVTANLQNNHEPHNPPIHQKPQINVIQSKIDNRKAASNKLWFRNDYICPVCHKQVEYFVIEEAIYCDDCYCIFCSISCFSQYHRYHELDHTGTTMDEFLDD